MKKILLVILFYFIALSLFVAHKIEIKNQKEIVVTTKAKLDKQDKDILIELLVENISNELRAQSVVGTLPAYSLSLIKRKLGLMSRSNEPYWLNIDLSDFYDLYLKINDKNPFGGFLLMDYNFGRYQTELSQKIFLNKLRNKYAIKIKLKTLNKNYLIKIYPILISDCIPPDDIEQPYCRVLNIKDSSKKIDYQYIAEYYKRIGLNSPIGPIADVDNAYQYTNFQKLKESEKLIDSIIKLKENNQIPIVKHFGYSIKAENTHKSLVSDNSDLESINKNIYYYYDAIERMNIPYMIMTGHHILTALDTLPVSRSKEISLLLRKRYPNALIITDELSMLQKYSNLETEELVRGSEGNMELIHAGLTVDIISKRNKIYKGLDLKNEEKIKRDLKKILSIKFDYGMIEITDEEK